MPPSNDKLTPEADALPPMPVMGDDRVAPMYHAIAVVHKQIVEVKWRAWTTKTKIRFDPALILHCEEAIAFLAEEMLTLRSMVEGVSK